MQSRASEGFRPYAPARLMIQRGYREEVLDHQIGHDLGTTPVVSEYYACARVGEKMRSRELPGSRECLGKRLPGLFGVKNQDVTPFL